MKNFYIPIVPAVFFTALVILFNPSSVYAAGPAIFDDNPEIKDRLLKWEKDAPDDVKTEINIIRKSANAVEKGYAIVSIGEKGERAKGAILALLQVFKDTTPLQWQRVDLAPGFGTKSTSPGREAAVSLGKIGRPAIEPLIEILKDEDSGLRMFAVVSLGEIKDPIVIAPLVGALKDKYSGVRVFAARALGKIKDPLAVAPLIDALNDNESGVRMFAAESLGEIKNQDSFNALISVLKDKSSGVRQYAVKALQKIDPKWRESKAAKELPPIFIGGLKDEKLSVRDRSAHALGELKDPIAVEPLIEALKDKNSGIHLTAARALGEIKDLRAVDALIEALKDENLHVRTEAALWLRKMTGKDFDEDQKKWGDWWESQKGK